MIDVIGFDADDTLWQNEFLYQEAKERFAELLSRYQSPEISRPKLDAIEVENIPFYGYGIKSFGLSMIETALEVMGDGIRTVALRELIAIIKDMLLRAVPLDEHAVSTLERLSGDYVLIMITKGDLFEQERKIHRSGLAKYFQHIEVVGDKTEERYRQLLDRYNIEPGRFLMVGNSLRSDILPVVRIGCKAVYIPNDQTWFHEEVDLSEFGEFEFGEIQHLGELPGYLKTQFG